MTHTDFTSVVAKAIYDKMFSVQDTYKVKSVFYGKQVMIPQSPAVVVMPGPKRRSLAGVAAPGGRTMNDLVVYIDVHTSKVGSESDERLALDILADNLEKEIHKDVTLGGIIIHGFVEEWDPGETFMQGGEFRSVRMTFIGHTKTYLSQ